MPEEKQKRGSMQNVKQKKEKEFELKKKEKKERKKKLPADQKFPLKIM